MKNILARIRIISWCIKISWKMNKSVLLFWTILSIAISILPSVALIFQRDILSYLSNFISSGQGTFQSVIPSILGLGGVLILIGLSSRFNSDVLILVLYDYYNLGMEELIMQCVHEVELKTLMQKEYIDEYRYIRYKFTTLANFLSGGLMLINQGVSIGALLVVTAGISPMIVAITIAYLTVVLIINFKLTDKARFDYVQHRGLERRTRYYEETAMQPGVAKEMRIYHTESSLVKQWEKEYEPIIKRDLRIDLWREIIAFLCSFGFYLFSVGIIVYSIFEIASGRLTVSNFLVIYSMALSVSTIIENFVGTFHGVDRNLFDLERVRKFLENIPRKPVQEESKPYSHDVPIVFEAKDMSFSYDGIKEVLHNLDFQVRKGETIALVGSNGSGKSTLVKLLIELYQPTKGELYFYEKPYAYFPKGMINQCIGMFFQDFKLFHATLRENVGFGDLENIQNDSKIMDAIAKGGAMKLFNRLKDGLEHWILNKVKKCGTNLSGGEQQKVAASRAYMSDKEILIFDEPAAALDPIAEMEQFKTIREKASGRTALLISHRIGFARLADRIFVMKDGFLAEVGNHEELMAADGIYADFFRQQAQWYEA